MLVEINARDNTKKLCRHLEAYKLLKKANSKPSQPQISIDKATNNINLNHAQRRSKDSIDKEIVETITFYCESIIYKYI